jgi:tetratricopeptide (TPR) repeat protein
MPRRVYPTPFIIHPPDDLVQKQPALRHLSSKLAQEYADRKVVREEDLQAMGSMLWSALGPAVQAAFDAAHAGAGAAILSILIESGASDVQALPWETLYHPTHRFVGKHPAFTLTRRIEAAPEASLPLDRGPLRVLLFTSLPDDVDPEKGRLDVEEEQAQVQEALLPWLAQGRVQLEMPDDGRFVTLQGLMKNFQPHVLFLSGHGSFHHEPHTGEAPYGVFSFEDDAGRSDAIKEDQIAQVLVGTGVQAVVISACESGKAASEALNNGLTRRISAQGIPHVIGMRESVTDRAGIRFARAFCDDLAQRERVDTALQAARIAIQSPLDDDIRRREAAFVAAEELSSGQWCLPMLLSANPHTPLIDWEFSPRAIEARRYGEHLSTVSLPPRFVGRRAEMRDYKSGLLRGAIQSLLITGPGGQGKTSLAGKLALDLQKQGWGVFAWSARPENPWRDFEFEMELALDEANAKRYNSYRGRFEGDAARAKFMLGLLTEQYGGRVVLFLDNLESLQDPVTLALPDAPAAAWLQTAQAMDGLILLATSRWALPGWTGEHLLLERASYGDFLRMAQELALRKQLPRSLLAKRDLLRRAYEALGGNPRGLEFFAAAARGMKDAEEEGAFLEALAQTKGDLQANMAIAEIHERLPEDARRLLARLPAYREAVPAEGLLKLGLDLPEPAALLERLLAVSLLEAQYEPEWQVIQYQCVPMVTDWLKARNLVDDDPCWLDAAADYSLYLWKQERRTLIQAIATHRALRRAGRDAEARRLALDYVVGPLTRAGFYATLLRDWLPRICESEDPDTRGAALGQTGKLLFHVGDYDTALRYLQQSLAIRQQIGDKAGEGTTLNNISQIYDAQGDYDTALRYLQQSLAIFQQIGDKAGEGATLNNISQIFKAQGDYDTALRYLQQSLAICQQIGDKAGLCATLFNMGHIHLQNEQLQEAVSAWVTVYLIAAPMNLAQVLRALAALAPQLGLPEGLAGWEMLAQRMQGGAGEASHKHSK